AQAEAVVDEIIPVSDVENPYEIFKQCIGKVPGRFALEKSYMTISQLEQFNQQLPTFSYEDIETYIWQMRANKSENEIAKIKQAIAISEQALQYTCEQIKIGMTDLEVKAELVYQMTILGADAISIDTIVLTGKQADLSHVSAGNTTINRGDCLLFDFG